MESNELTDSVVTITGGTGSFGSTMARYLLREGVGEVRIFSRDEAKQDAMRHSVGDSRLKFYLGDTRDPDSVEGVIRGSNYVFHAAALKQVPSAEFFPLEAIKTNIHGSANVLRSSVKHLVESVVCLSTDKAVYPINAMGMTKALMEKTAMAFARDYSDQPTRIAVTRYGNVMHSRGSVIPLMISQIEAGSSITITDGQMTRFLMSLDESVELVMHAFRSSSSGDLFVRKAPAATVFDLARALIELFDGDESKLVTIGARHGEKLYESLLSVEERVTAEDQGDFFRVPLDTRDLNYSMYFEEGTERPKELDAYTSHNTERLDVEGVKRLLLTLPEIREALDA